MVAQIHLEIVAALSTFPALLSLTGMNKRVCPYLAQGALTYIYVVPVPKSSNCAIRSAKI